MLDEFQGQSSIIFVATCNNALRVALLLRSLGFKAVCLHGMCIYISYTAYCISKHMYIAYIIILYCVYMYGIYTPTVCSVCTAYSRIHM